MKLTANSYISDIEPYKAGKSKALGSNKPAIKLSSNENALKASPKAIAAYKDFSANIHRYNFGDADGNCTVLRAAIAQHHDINPDNITCGAGSDEIIALLCQAFATTGDQILYSQYGFLMYPISAKRVGAEPVIAKESSLCADIDNILSAITDKTRIIFLANPNNPTGSYLNNHQLEKLIKAIPENVILALDMAYAEFVDIQDYPNGIDLVARYDNVVMIRTFSKIYGLAGLRLGWCYASNYITDILNRVRGPFNVSGAAQIAGIAAVKDQDFIKKSKAHNDKWLKIIAARLNENNIKFYPSLANFILIDFLTIAKCNAVNNFLMSSGIILRDVAAYSLPHCLRMTVGTEEENIKALDLLLEAVNLK